MVGPRSKLALMICVLVVLTTLAAISVASVVLVLAADWQAHHNALVLTMKIMWGTWLVLLAGTLLTWATMVGWRFRRALPDDRSPMGLLRSIQAGTKPPAWAKSGWTSFTFTVILVSLTGTAILATVLLWILGDWNRFNGPLWLAVKLIWGQWWLFSIITVLVRVAIFGKQKRNIEDSQDHSDKDPPDGPESK